MRAREFAFWLQGFFEIDGSTNAMTTRQAKDIVAKIEKVDMTATANDDSDKKAQAFVQFANGALSPVFYMPQENQAAFLEGVTARLRKDLNDLFVHAIDATIPGDQSQHRRAHRPEDRGGRATLC